MYLPLSAVSEKAAEVKSLNHQLYTKVVKESLLFADSLHNDSSNVSSKSVMFEIVLVTIWHQLR